VRTSVVAISLVVALGARFALRRAAERVPFIGCPGQGQLGFSASPSGEAKSVDVPATLARQIAYYTSDGGPGVFAPRGWRCRGWNGSNGAGIIVRPTAIDSMQFPPRGIQGPGVTLDATTGQTSGRFDVADGVVRLFPAMAVPFVQAVKEEDPATASTFPKGPYPDDRIRYLDSTVAEFTTPPYTAGLGTAQYFAPSSEPVHGIGVLFISDSLPPDLDLLRIRLQAGKDELERALLEVNRLCMQGREPCPRVLPGD
jgi:hypothetical protein